MLPSEEYPGAHLEPPDDLAERTLPLVETKGPWSRIHRVEYEPLYFGRSGDNRFDAPAGEYGVLYVGEDEHCAFIETFGQQTGTNLVSGSELEARGLAKIEAKRLLDLVDLTGPGLARIGADGRLFTGEHAVARRWALALWSHPSRPCGLYYRARHDPSRFSVALYESVADTLRATPQGHLMEPRNLSLLGKILDAYRFGFREPTV